MTPDRFLMVRLPDQMHKALRVRAAELGIPMSEIVRALIEAWLNGRILVDVQEQEKQQ